MIAKLEFDLDEPSDRAAHMRCVKSLDMALALLDMGNGLRTALKYGAFSTEVYKALEDVQTRFLATLDGHNLDIDEMVE